LLWKLHFALKKFQVLTSTPSSTLSSDVILY
jgi:hypothetical protein